jgi:hypothetical protein
MIEFMQFIQVGTIAVAIIAAFGAWLSQRAAAKATNSNLLVSGKLDAERDAYNRARVFDLQTIERQNVDLKELREENKNLRKLVIDIRERLDSIEKATLKEMWSERYNIDRQEPTDEH